MKYPTIQKLQSILFYLTISLIPIQMIGSFINTVDSIDKGYGHSYSVMTYVLIAVWLLIVIADDVFIITNRQFICSKALSAYWGISIILLLVVLVCIPSDNIYIAMLVLITPYAMLYPLLEMFLLENTIAIFSVVILFCGINFCICKLLSDKRE